MTISSVIALEYPDKIEAYMGLVNMALGVGLASGPAFTTLLEVWFDYIVIEYFFSGFIILTGIASAWVVPKRIDAERNEEGAEKAIDVPYSEYFKNRRVLMALIAQVISGAAICFFDPILALRMESIGVDEDRAGLSFVTLAGAFAISAPFAGIMAESIDCRIIIQTGFVGLTVGLCLTGSLDTDSVSMTYVGLVVTGIMIACTMVPLIPEIIGVMTNAVKKREESQ